MGYVCLLLLIVNSLASNSGYSHFHNHSGDVKIFVLIFLPLIIGMFLCLYHAFTDRQKTNLEKKFMILFAAIVNGYSGIWYGTYILVNNAGWGLLPFPVWNIISGYILIASVRATDIEEITISDANVSFKKLLVGTLVVTILFLICHFLFKLVWAGTFSICIAWATNLNSSINTIMSRQQLNITRL